MKEVDDGTNKRRIHTYKVPPYLSRLNSSEKTSPVSDEGKLNKLRKHSLMERERKRLNESKPKIMSAGRARKCRTYIRVPA